jgi:hypothetical protein
VYKKKREASANTLAIQKLEDVAERSRSLTTATSTL